MSLIHKETFIDMPPVLYRGFEKESYADSFANGEIRFGNLKHYKKIEDKKRRDCTEGFSIIRQHGIVTNVNINTEGQVTKTWEESGVKTIHSQLGNVVYILSLSFPPKGDIELIGNKFGKFFIKINEPSKFVCELESYFNSLSNHDIMSIELKKVSYTADDEIHEKLTTNDRIDLSYYQKPDLFSDEFEYRIVLITKELEFDNEVPEYREASIGSTAKYIEKIKV